MKPRGAWSIGAGAALAVTTSCHSPPPTATQAECDELVDRYTELALRESLPDASPELVRDQKAKVRELAKEDAALSACAGHVTLAERACALAAESPDAFESCLGK